MASPSEPDVTEYKADAVRILRSGGFLSADTVPEMERLLDELKTREEVVWKMHDMPNINNAEKLAQIRRDREAYYGDAYRNMETLGKQLTGLLEQHYKITLPHPVPAHLADLFLVMVKANRMCHRYNADNYDDAHNYLSMAQEHQQQWEAERRAAAGSGSETSSSSGVTPGSEDTCDPTSSPKGTGS